VISARLGESGVEWIAAECFESASQKVKDPQVSSGAKIKLLHEQHTQAISTRSSNSRQNLFIAIEQTRDESKTFFHNRTRLPGHLARRRPITDVHQYILPCGGRTTEGMQAEALAQESYPTAKSPRRAAGRRQTQGSVRARCHGIRGPFRGDKNA
jgi:hypothetical protein